MSFKVTKLTVGKGKTTADEKQSEWTRQYFEVEIAVADERDVEQAKASAEGLIDEWLSGTQGMGNLPAPKGSPKLLFDVNKIHWEKTEGPKGPYEKTDDTNSMDYKELLKTLQDAGGRIASNGFFYWVFDNGHTVCRKLSKEVKHSRS